MGWGVGGTATAKQQCHWYGDHANASCFMAPDFGLRSNVTVGEQPSCL